MQSAISHLLSICAALLSLGLGGVAHAAAITLGSASNITGDADVITHGSLVGAINLNGATTTVNGVTFQSLTAAWGNAPGSSASLGNFSLTGGNYVSAETGTSVALPFLNMSADYKTMIGTALQWPFFDMTLTLSGLNVGQNYTFQVWANHSDDERFLYGLFVDNIANPLSAGHSLEVDPGIWALSSLGQYVVGTFTADAATQNIVFAPDEVGYISGFQLRQLDTQSVPEPGTLALAALGLAGMAWRRGRQA